MDPRVREHAQIIVDRCIAVESGDEVLIQAPAEADDLAVAINELIGERGAYPMYYGSSNRARRAFMRALDPAEYEGPPEIFSAIAEAADALIAIDAASNTNETSDVAPETTTVFAELMKPIQDEILGKRWVRTQHPAPGNAQDAEMSTAAYEDFVYEAIIRDWDQQHDFQSDMEELLQDGSEVRIVSGESTDLTMSIEGMQAVNRCADNNLPDGEVFTAPVPDSVEGEVLFDKPLMAHGREVTGVHLTFEDGKAIEHRAEKNQEVLDAVLETDEGARRLGELGIGMNRDIDRFTKNMLFDEKMGDTIHLALGRSIEESVGPDREGNDSAIHMDMIVDMSEDSRIEIDGEVVQRNGRFVFEDGFGE